ncbi:MAG: hypothetical protein ACKPFK_33155 [Dolichospermum sp.]
MFKRWITVANSTGCHVVGNTADILLQAGKSAIVANNAGCHVVGNSATKELPVLLTKQDVMLLVFEFNAIANPVFTFTVF